MFESHLLLMTVFAGIVSVMTGFLKFEEARAVFRCAGRMFAVMTVGGVLLSWLLALA